MTEKVCRLCGKRKPIDDFYTHGNMADGHLSKCKDCTKAYVKQLRDADLDKNRERERVQYRLRALRKRDGSKKS